MRKLMVAVAAVAGLALTAGCTRNEAQQERRELVETQREAQEEIAEARQEANKERAEIQRDEHEEIVEAQREVSEQEKEVYEADRERAEDLRDNNRNLGATAMNETVQGRVRSTTGDSLVLVVPGKANSELKLKTNDNTRITQNNVDVELDDFKEGTEVRASYVADGEDLVARDVVIITPVKK